MSLVAEKINHARKDGGANSPPTTFASLLSSVFSNIAVVATDAASRVSEAEANHRKELVAVSHGSAAEFLKGIAPSLQSQQQQVVELQRQMASCQKSLSEMTRYLNTDRQELSSEIRRLRSSEFNRVAVNPVLQMLCRAAKDAVQACGQLRQKFPQGSEACDAAIDLLERVAAKRQEDLSTHGVVSFSAQRGDAFDPARHEAIRREKRPTDEPNLHGRVAEEESPGFVLDDTILEKSTVVLFQHVETNQPALVAKE